MSTTFSKLTYLDLQSVPRSVDASVARFYQQVQLAFKRMAGEFAAGDRVITVADLNSVIDSDLNDADIVNILYDHFSAAFLAKETPRWCDFNIGAISLGSGASAPDLINLASTNIMVPSFDGTVTSEQMFGSIELDHMYKEGTDIYFHIHWYPTTNNAGNVKWLVDYIVASADSTMSTATTISTVSASPGTAWKNTLTELPAISGTGRKIGDQVTFRLYRTPADAADTYAFDVAVHTVGLHVQVDSLGSTQKYIK